MFKLISTCTSAKKTWNILQTVHEGIEHCRVSKLEMLTARLEELRMQEDYNIALFSSKLREIAKRAFQLGETLFRRKASKKNMKVLTYEVWC